MRENTYLEDIEKLVSEYKYNKNRELINLSDWNPSSDFVNELAKELPNKFVQNAISYIFSSNIDKTIKNKVVEKLGFKEKKNLDISFFDSGSLSILNIIHFLSSMGIKRIVSVCPLYFSISPLCDELSIQCDYIDIQRNLSMYNIPNSLNEFISDDCCLWITNPIYCTGVYYSIETVKFLNQVIKEKNIYIVIDESLSEPQHYISPMLNDCNCFTIVSPHKALCTNGLKFSAVLFPEAYSKVIDSWSDISTGCLSISALTAIHHFISDNYQMYLDKFNSIIMDNKKSISRLLEKYHVQYDVFSESYLLSLYFPNIPYDFYDDLKNLIAFIDRTFSYFIPNSRNYFPKIFGFSFRINLCCVSDQYIYALERSIIYLQSVM